MTTMTADPKFWDNLAEKYAAQPVADVPAWERKLEFQRALVGPDHTVLDIGCGTGSLALQLAPRAAHVHGLDLSPEMVRIAEGKARAAGADNVTFHAGTLDSVSFGPGSFQGVCAYSILHLVEDRAETLRQLFELLEPGGFFVSSTVVLGASWVPYRAILPVMRWLGKAPYVAIIDRDTVMAEVRAAGFVDVEEVDVGAKPVVAYVSARKPE